MMPLGERFDARLDEPLEDPCPHCGKALCPCVCVECGERLSGDEWELCEACEDVADLCGTCGGSGGGEGAWRCYDCRGSGKRGDR